jgi:O-antigen ligase
MIMLPGAFLLVANFLNDVKRLKAMVVIMLIAGVLGVAKRLGQVGIPVNTEGLFTMWIIALSAGLALFNNRLPLIVRGLLMVLTGYWVYWGFSLHISWLAGWLPGFVALGVLAFMRSKKLALTLLIFVVIFVAANSNYYLESVIQDEQESSGQYRVAAWEVNWRVTGKHVLFGTGPAGYAAYYMSYFPHDAMATHSNYIDILAQTGIIGFGLCVWFFIALAWMGYKLCLRLRGQGDFREGLANAALAGTVACIVIMAFGDWLFPFAYTQSIAGFSYAVYSWLFMGTILALEGLTRTEPGVMEDA